ncbi:MAG: hypothetical protein LBD92_02545, partial [Oscillospiraceae bacterium]|nr:hypothetical protein [Oscillospiraceae bacterium]
LTTAHTAMATPAAAQIVKINYVDEKLEFQSGFNPTHYTVKIGENQISNGGSVTEYADTDFTVYVTRNASDNYPESAPDTLTIKGRANAPKFGHSDAATDISSDGAITCSGNFQYRVKTEAGSGAWASATNSASVPIGTYDARAAATQTAFASKIAAVEIASLSLAVSVVSLTAVDGAPGTANTTSLTVTFSRDVAGFGDTSRVSFTGDSKDAFTVSGIAPSGDQTPNTAWNIAIASKPGYSVASASGSVTLTAQFVETWEDTGGSHKYTLVGGATQTVTAHLSWPWETPAAAIDYVNERLTGLVSGAEYSVNEAKRTAGESGLQIDESWMKGSSYAIVRTGVGDTGGGVGRVASLPQTLTIPARPAAPQGTVTNQQSTGTSDGAITITNPISDAVYEYRLYQTQGSETGGYINVTGGAITGLAPGVYELRVKAAAPAEGTPGNFAGASQAFRVRGFQALDFGDVFQGYGGITPLAIAGSDGSAIDKVELVTGSVDFPDDKHFTLTTDNNSYTIAPNANLSPKYGADGAVAPYKAQIKITYTDGEQSGAPETRPVTLEVHPKLEFAASAPAVASGTDDRDDQKHLTDTLTLKFTYPVVLKGEGGKPDGVEWSDIAVSGAAVKTTDGQLTVTGDGKTISLPIRPLVSAKTGDTITVSVNLETNGVYHFQATDSGGGNDSTYATVQNSDATVTVPRAIESAKAVTLIDGYSTGYIQFTLKRDDGYSPIEPISLEEDTILNDVAYSGKVKITYTDTVSGGDELNTITPLVVARVDADMGYTYRVFFIPPRNGGVTISIPSFGVAPVDVEGSIAQQERQFNEVAYLLDGNGNNYKTDLNDAHQILSNVAYDGTSVISAGDYTLRLDREYGAWTVTQLSVSAGSGEPEMLAENSGYTVVGGGGASFIFDGVERPKITNQLQITLKAGWAYGDGTYYIRAVLKASGDGDVYAVMVGKITLSGMTPSWILTVTNGSGGGRYPANTDVTISAPASITQEGAENNGHVFHEWSVTVQGGGTPGVFANKKSASTTYRTTAAAAVVTALYKARPAAPEAVIDYANERLTGLSEGRTYSYVLSGGARGVFTAQPGGVYALPPNDAWLPSAGEWEMALTLAATENDPESHPQTIALPARGGSPGAVGENEKYAGLGGAIKLPVTSAAMEYSGDDGKSWTAAATATQSVNVPSGEYLVRYKAKNDAFASLAKRVTVEASATAPTWSVAVSPAAPSFTADYGYGAISPVTLTVTNTGNQPTGQLTVSVGGADPGCFDVSKTTIESIPPSGTASFTAAPVAALGAASYSATITVSGGAPSGWTFTNGSANVSFTVAQANIVGFA